MRRRQIRLPRAFPTRAQLLVGFTILVALLLAALAVAVGQLLRESIREAALSGAEQTGRVFVELEVGAEEYKDGKLTDQAREDLDTAVETSSALRGARIWNRDLALLYSDRGTSDAPLPRSGPLRTAVAGETASAVSGLEGAGAACSRSTCRSAWPATDARATCWSCTCPTRRWKPLSSSGR